jgi:creatinine amidohydrolase/Fe(II)-dependent formamide hydrolase-like protein
MTNTNDVRTRTLEDFWGEPISTYTRQQAIEDGVLVDVHGSRLEHLEAALTALDHHLEMRVVRGVARSTDVPGPRPRRFVVRRRPVGAAGTEKPARTR